MVDLFGKGSTWDKRHVIVEDPNYAVGDVVRTSGAGLRQKSLTTVHLRMRLSPNCCWVGVQELTPKCGRNFAIWKDFELALDVSLSSRDGNQHR